ncbi:MULTISPECIES: hypothetical protein [Caproicibacterium]|uniref:Uncharacterized protein n=1 Tax=Caproicibacterium argilliputei TaxID=3030016 RepID=A0AA97DB21_9FIRM|nr:hypothetical protein [Caproicibacterium argilliputei]WOC32151.1 hypothetical protein PXC00_13325 [Caproicibacterium argilliputei]
MTRAALVADLLVRYGSEASCGEQQAHILLRPLRDEEQEDNRYRMTAPHTFCPQVGETIACEGHFYTVLRCDGVFAGGERLYTWAVLEQQDGWGR